MKKTNWRGQLRAEAAVALGDIEGRTRASQAKARLRCTTAGGARVQCLSADAHFVRTRVVKSLSGKAARGSYCRHGGRSIELNHERHAMIVHNLVSAPRFPS